MLKTAPQYSERIQYLRKQIARRPALKQEVAQLCEEIAERKLKVEDGTLTEKALTKPQNELDAILNTIWMIDNEWPNGILNSMSGELKAEHTRLRSNLESAVRFRQAQLRSLNESRLAHKDVERRISEMEGFSRLPKHEQESLTAEVKASADYLKAIEEQYRLNAAQEDAAREAMNQFRKEHIYGECENV